jgi:hypothetical protein
MRETGLSDNLWIIFENLSLLFMGILESYAILKMNEEEDYEKSPPHMKSNVSPSAKAEGLVISGDFPLPCGICRIPCGSGLLLPSPPVK